MPVERTIFPTAHPVGIGAKRFSFRLVKNKPRQATGLGQLFENAHARVVEEMLVWSQGEPVIQPALTGRDRAGGRAVGQFRARRAEPETCQ